MIAPPPCANQQIIPIWFTGAAAEIVGNNSPVILKLTYLITVGHCAGGKKQDCLLEKQHFIRDRQLAILIAKVPSNHIL